MRRDPRGASNAGLVHRIGANHRGVAADPVELAAAAQGRAPARPAHVRTVLS
jgi:hypothetical protein